MPGDGSTQIVIYVVLALVVIAAIVWGRRLRLRVGKVFDARVDSPEERKIGVLDDARVTSANLGNVTGERRGPDGAGAKQVSVMNAATITGGSVGDITGSDVQATPPDKE